MNLNLKIFFGVSVVALGVSITIIGCATKKQVDELDRKIDNIQNEVNRLQKKAENINVSIMNQNSVLDRTIGKYIPIQIPEDLNKDISSLEEQGKNPDRWPRNMDEAKQFSEALVKCIKSTPPWAEKELLQRFNILRWEEAAFRIIRTKPNEIDIAYCDEIQQAQIDGVPPKLIDVLKETIKKAENSTKTTKRAGTIKMAKDAILNKSDFEKALEELVYLLEEKDQEAIKYYEKLSVLLINKKAREQIENLGKNLVLISKISDWQLKQAGYNQIASVAIQQYLNWRSEEIINKDNLIDIDSLRKKAQNEVDNISKKRMMDYQKWAFEQIKKMSQINTLIEAACKEGTQLSLDKNVKPLLKESSVSELTFKKEPGTIYGEKVVNVDEVKHKAISMAMRQYLVPINMGLLDIGISQLYQKEWEKNWKYLEGKLEQDEVAKASAIVKKKGLNDELTD